ncbi:MAG: alkene reductase [Bacteroidales bacterium]|nr:alkene reductase [Bacteroidales bacterium]
MFSEKQKKPVLLSPVTLGKYKLRNRVIMAPLTRRRCTEKHVPTDIMRIYYEQRASAGLIIAEAAAVSPQAIGYMNSPGIYTQEQVNAWKPITKAVHNKNGLIFLQLWHVGRISHPFIQPDGRLPVSASAKKAEGYANTPKGKKPFVTPRALNTDEIPGIINDFKNASENAIEAGFDGVEIHGANGYLLDQFLHDGSNIRTDNYGGSIRNRSRLLMEVTQAISKTIGSERVGVRLSPSGIYKDMIDSNPVKLYESIITQLSHFQIAYLHLLEPLVLLEPEKEYSRYLKVITPHFRKFYKGTLITNCGYDFKSGNKIIEDGHADLVAFGKLFISNPDLVERFATGAPLNPWDEDTFYYGGGKGYIDYPLLDAD